MNLLKMKILKIMITAVKTCWIFKIKSSKASKKFTIGDTSESSNFSKNTMKYNANFRLTFFGANGPYSQKLNLPSVNPIIRC